MGKIKTFKPLVEDGSENEGRPGLGRGDTMATISHGLPEMTEAEKAQNEAKSKKFIAVFLVAALIIGALLGLAVHFALPGRSYDKKLALIKEFELQYLYLGGVVLVHMVFFINFYPMIYKSRVMRSTSGNLRANMYIYKVAAPSAGPPVTVVLEDSGDVGMYNRANRSLTHMVENLPATLVAFSLSGFLYPAVTAVLCVVFSTGRCLHAVGYTRGYGSHGAGFGLATLSTLVAEGLLVVTVLKGFEVF
mmetsp:Transcript_62293/g.103577  ORF Transcript_62293/g.103577 Transcript_62293/m.103577 type:complete len:248 (-) Transcript_62293:127-870(-)|eukprot:CAMPEP_0119301672 /NCGR_PEP_ID=MMETSP1333-20130426/3408_1 /TAXON_ID=418940 /ORGANISM="Scyphosphaera apsteinii, Strain RCC1455" /LENGTH=247 /DNA_ID=CAMNT_0007303803 /DNA_START=94 /DNA_END=837 /DNA_ORIENTATION=-